ncbi:asparagine synthase-related protein [Aliarcobacter butzleri]
MLSQIQGNGIIKSSVVDLKTYLPNDMFYYDDIMSMENSFEVRFHLLEHKIIQLITSIEPKWRIKNGQTKYLMKKLLKNKVPDSIICKKKLGLNPPIGIWLRNDLKELVSEYLSKKNIEKRDLFNYKFVKKIIYDFETNKRDISLNIWVLIVLEEWFRQYIDKKGE